MFIRRSPQPFCVDLYRFPYQKHFQKVLSRQVQLLLNDPTPHSASPCCSAMQPCGQAVQAVLPHRHLQARSGSESTGCSSPGRPLTLPPWTHQQDMPRTPLQHYGGHGWTMTQPLMWIFFPFFFFINKNKTRLLRSGTPTSC